MAKKKSTHKKPSKTKIIHNMTGDEILKKVITTKAIIKKKK